MNILFTMTGSWGTGSGTVVEAVSRELVRHGHRVQVLLPEGKQEGADSGPAHQNPDISQQVWRFPVVQSGVELYTFPLMIADPNPSNYRGAWTFKDLSREQFDLYVGAFQQELTRAIEDFKPDVIECEHVWLMAYAAAQMGLPYVAVAHHSDQMGYRYDQRMQPYAREAARRAEYVFAISRAVKEDVIELYGLTEERVPLIFNGYDQTVFRPRATDRQALFAAHDLSIPEGALVVTFAGKLSRTKGIDLMLLANREIQKQVPVHFLVFGTGELEDVLDDDLSEAYSLENVHFMGHRSYETIATFHNAADFSIMPSRTEGFGIAALEAMGCGLPIVITEAGGVDEYAVGAVIEPGRADVITDAVLDMASRGRDELKRLGARAREAATAFSWAAITEQRLSFYDEMVAQRPAYDAFCRSSA